MDPKDKPASRNDILDVMNASPNRETKWVTFDAAAVYEELATEIGAMATRDPGDSLYLFIDGETAASHETLDAARAVARRVIVFGTLPEGWQRCDNVAGVPPADFAGTDRLLIALSSRHNFALFGKTNTAAPQPAAFQGYCSGHRPDVERLASMLAQHDPAAAEYAPAAPESDICSAHVTSLMAHLSQSLTAMQHTISMDKNDLFSVLEILKAISARRRSHDILYVFVEQIARVVQMERCSVVRVWGGESRGHVLASHEDEHVRDLAIDLRKYPELRHALDTRHKVIVDDIQHAPLTAEFTAELRRADIQSLIVIPIVLFDANVGSLFLRAARKHAPFTAREISFFEIVAEAASNALERAHLFESIQKANERLELLAITDGLTGLYNHRHFRTRIEEEFERARRYALPLSCMIFDIDNFKKINDSFGHLQGDRILREMATRVLKVTRRIDLVARYGGEEFVVIMPQTGLEGAQAQAQRLLSQVREKPYQGMPQDFVVTASIGLSVLDHEAMLDCEALIRFADDGLYEAKRQGKNCICIGKTGKTGPIDGFTPRHQHENA